MPIVDVRSVRSGSQHLPAEFTQDLLDSLIVVRAFSEVRTFAHLLPLVFQLRRHWRVTEAQRLDDCQFVRLTSSDYRFTFWASWLLVRACFEQED